MKVGSHCEGRTARVYNRWACDMSIEGKGKFTLECIDQACGRKKCARGRTFRKTISSFPQECKESAGGGFLPSPFKKDSHPGLSLSGKRCDSRQKSTGQSARCFPVAGDLVKHQTSQDFLLHHLLHCWLLPRPNYLQLCHGLHNHWAQAEGKDHQ